MDKYSILVRLLFTSVFIARGGGGGGGGRCDFAVNLPKFVKLRHELSRTWELFTKTGRFFIVFI